MSDDGLELSRLKIREACRRILASRVPPREGAYEVMRAVDLAVPGPTTEHPLWPEFREFYSALDQWESSEPLARRLHEDTPEGLVHTYESMIIDEARLILNEREPDSLG